MVSSQEALKRLKEGNQRFVAGRARDPRVTAPQRERLAGGQTPFATILGCADSRVAPEIVFDRRLGELFVVRVAGNVPTDAVVGSVEFAVGELGANLVVVLGHSKCGAVQAALSYAEAPDTELSPNLRAVVEPILPSVQPLREREAELGRAALVEEIVQSNALASAEMLCRKSEFLSAAVAEGKVTVVGAKYDLETGAVDFLQPEA